MRVYWEYVRRSFARGLSYRTNVFLRIVGNLVGILIQVAMWRALLGRGAVGGVNVHDMVTYAMLSTSIGMLLLTHLFRTVDERLRTGDVAVDLVKPLRYPLLLAAQGIGETAFYGLFTMIPTLALAATLFGLSPPASVGALAACLAAVLIAFVISFALGYLIALLAFWFLTTMHFEWSLAGFTKVFSGAFLPLWFFPPWLGVVAAWLPFRYLNFVPVAFYLGKIPAGDAFSTLGVGAAWAVVLLGFALWLWSRSVRRLVVQGG